MLMNDVGRLICPQSFHKGASQFRINTGAGGREPMGDLITMGADDLFSGLGYSLEVLAIGLKNLELRGHHHDAFVSLLNQELGNPFFKGCLVLGIPQAFLRLTQEGKEPADVVVQNTHALRLQTGELDKGIAGVRKFNKGIEIPESAKVLKIAGGIDSHLPGHAETLRLRINIADPEDRYVEIGKGLFSKKLQKRLACLAAPDDRQIEAQLLTARGSLLFLVLHGIPSPPSK